MIVVSNRGPFSFRREPDGSFTARRGAGGVVSALGPLLLGGGAGRRDDPVRWVAAAIGDDDRAAVEADVASVEEVDLRLLAIDPADQRAHYDVVSNSTLWFLVHGLFDLTRRPRFEPVWFEAWAAYERVNRGFADAVIEIAAPDEVVLVQDYHLLLVPGMLRAARPDLRVVLFVHTPWCGPNSMRILPTAVAEAICRSIASVPTGFHTSRWARSFTASALDVLGDGAPEPVTFVSSLGPDRDALSEVATSEAARAAASTLAASVGDRRVVVRSDRIEPSKNIARGFLAFDQLLAAHPEWRGEVVLAAMCYPSREGLPEYLAYRHEVDATAAAVNRRWGTPEWTPILLSTDDDFPRSIAALARADVFLVNPIRDGLNLVAKEGPLVNERDAVLCLSPEAGAWEELGPAALAAHPYDLVATAEALHDALVMPPADRTRRARDLRSRAAARTPADWLADQLEAARR